MKLKNTLIVVRDMERSKSFYKELFGLEVIADYDGNVVLTEGLVLQDASVWEKFIEQDVGFKGNDAELFFEENDMDAFIKKLEAWDSQLEYVNRLMEHDWGQRVVRLYDPDHHMIEVGESLDYVAKRFLALGMSVEDVAWKTQMALGRVEELARGAMEE